MKRILPFLAILLVLPSVVSAENHYVIQDGSGDGSSLGNAWSVADFNDAANWNSAVDTDDGYIGPRDTVYFSGMITTSDVRPQGSGVSGAYITLDGWQGGDCNPVENDGCPEATLVNYPSSSYQGVLQVIEKSHIILQDFSVTNSLTLHGKGILIDENSHDIIVRRNHVYEAGDRAMNFIDSYDVTCGGGKDQGNLIENSGLLENDDQMLHIKYVHDGVFSYNKIGYSDEYDLDLSNNCVTMHGCENILFEYNEVYNAQGQSGLAPKEPGNKNVIIRFNNFHDCDGDDGRGLSPSWYSDSFLVYGNIMQHNERGITPGKDSQNLFFWSNVIVDNIARGIEISRMTDTPIMSVDNGHIYGNTIVNNGVLDDNPSHTGFYASALGDRGILMKNNILVNNGRGPPGYEQMYLKDVDKNKITIEHDQYFHKDGIVKWIWDTIAYPKTLSEIQAMGYEDDITSKSPGGQIGTPLLDGGYRIPDSDSPAIDSADILDSGMLPTITIQGVTYGPQETGERYIGFDIALHPSTDWTAFPSPSTVVTANQNDYGSGWERGAYVYTGDEPQDTCFSLNGYCCMLPDTCLGIDLGTYPDCSGTCCSEGCQAPIEETCTDRGFHCCSECVPGTEHPENDTDCSPQVCCGTCLSQPIQGEYNYSIIRTAYSPVINADISEFAYADTITIQETDSGTTGTYRLMWDENTLYIAAEFSDNTLNTLSTENDTGLWGDDSLEIMFDTDNDGGDTSPQPGDYKFFASPAGLYADSHRYDLDWDTRVIYTVSVSGTVNNNGDSDAGYVVEMAIPWQDWGISEPVFGSVWGMNIQLNDLTATEKFATQWSGSGLGVNVPDGWNDALFTVRADSSRDGCVAMKELVEFIESWKYDSTTYPMRELMEAVGLWKAQVGCA